jgi:hypothetical protein
MNLYFKRHGVAIQQYANQGEEQRNALVSIQKKVKVSSNLHSPTVTNHPQS